MGCRKISMGVVILISWASWVHSSTPECSTIIGLFSACSTFITYGSPDPLPGSPCCDAMSSLHIMADTTENRRFVCRCLMDLITIYNPNATAIATLPGFCGLSLGFTIDPSTDCNSYDLYLKDKFDSLDRPNYVLGSEAHLQAQCK